VCRCFQAHSESHDDDDDENNQNTVHSSWLTTIHWISCLIDVTEDTRDSADYNNDDIQSEIQHIQSQLNQVKRRLGPAAERSTEAYNSKMNGDVTTGRKELEHARRACNPMEALGEGQGQGLNNLFMNRSAMKLANIDAALGFFLTTTTTCLGDDDVFSFADLCASPGGFSKCKEATTLPCFEDIYFFFVSK
jgi:hypothetical protein